MESNLSTFTKFRDRYYKSTNDRHASKWSLARVQSIVGVSGAIKATALASKHTFYTQDSIITTIPGRSNNTIVVGAHFHCINVFANLILNDRAPGADDDASGSFTDLEASKVLLTDEKTRNGQVENTIEFHWYAAEKGGLFGSQAIFDLYKRHGREVKAMLQQDMTGYVKSGTTERIVVVTDYVDAGLTKFVKKIITLYCTIPYVETECEYACSDHASASVAGHPSAFAIEAAMDDTSENFSHSDDITLKLISFSHMLEHAKFAVGFAFKLEFASEW